MEYSRKMTHLNIHFKYWTLIKYSAYTKVTCGPGCEGYSHVGDIVMLVTKMAKTVINILRLSLTYFVSNIDVAASEFYSGLSVSKNL